jgi:archaellum component FlaC
MLKANIQAQIEQKTQQLNQVDKDIWKLANVISGLNKQLEILRKEKEDLEYKIEDLQEELEDE